MTDVIYLPKADDDLSDIFWTIAFDNEEAAERMIRRIKSAVLRLADYPLSAPAHPEIASGIRGLTVGRYMVLHRVEREQVLVVRVIHMSRDLVATFDSGA